MTEMTIDQHRKALAEIKAQMAALRREYGMNALEGARDHADAALAADAAEAAAALVKVSGALAAAGPRLDEYWRKGEELRRRANEHIRAINAKVKAARQERENAAQARAIRAKTCGSCFTVHAGECY
ncbi:hypothetical protein [Thermomonospora cellulosilytica]|uniref:Cytochrome c556 n=1 Tax=Thermomonospora cellulosilytica TaxID=1411118 RepID=A0A7W3N1X1_9ACTN|nr:hypothetical protein [Thermomonospora cellulosilytica]MBA9005962.1 cytochrome c556 [Thermomonospora cellulosilytica]